MAKQTLRVRNKGLVKVKVADLEDAPWNFRTHPQAQQDALAGVVEELGWHGYPEVYKTPEGKLRLTDGHLRKGFLVGKYGPDAEIEVSLTDFDEAEARKATLTIDPLAALAENNRERLDALLKESEVHSAPLIKMLEGMAAEAGCEWHKPEEIVEDEVPEVPKVPVTKPGDIWLMGDHRLCCGDSTKAEDLEKLLGGVKVKCVFTDPPYGVSIGKKNRTLNTFQRAGRCLTDIVDDDLSPEDLEKSLLAAFINLRVVAMDEDCSLFVCSPQGCGLSMMMMMQKAGLKARRVLIWVKNQPTFSVGRLDYDYQHEPILFTWLKRHKRPMGGTHKTSVWKIDKPRSSDLHPTMKPVALYANGYLNNSDAGDAVLDIYAGSGTGLIAAEQTGRRFFGMEVSPNYCDVIRTRWENITLRKAKLAHRIDQEAHGGVQSQEVAQSTEDDAGTLH